MRSRSMVRTYQKYTVLDGKILNCDEMKDDGSEEVKSFLEEDENAGIENGHIFCRKKTKKK